MHSTAHANGKAVDEEPPHASAAPIVRIGRIRFPPANRLYRIALWIVVGLVRELGRY